MNPVALVFSRWQSLPLYVRTLIGMSLGAVTGVFLKQDAVALAQPGKVLMGLVQMLAAPVAFFAIVHALAGAKIEKGKTAALIKLLATNTIVAILIGLTVANLIKPGERRGLSDEERVSIEQEAASISTEIASAKEKAQSSQPQDKVLQILEKLPRSILGPFTDGGSVIGVIVIAIMLGLALRQVSPNIEATTTTIKVFMDAFITMLHWIVQLVPIIVFGVVAAEVGKNGFSSFISLLWLVVAVLLALALQFTYYMTRISLQSWVTPRHLLRSCRDALAMAFSTASSTATMPLTYECLVDRVRVRKQSANLGALVGANFNNDGTALYEAMAALFIAQLLGRHLGIDQQLIIVLCAVAASVGAAGIPSAGLITMTLVLTAVGLPLEYSLLLIPIDWFLDRFRTMINVCGDLCVSCVLDGKTPGRDDELTHLPHG
jgi:DAACS family dicarboxylate/amino acid:cation (Na+ or H+) symporter